jgi:hypothetical protein
MSMTRSLLEFILTLLRDTNIPHHRPFNQESLNQGSSNHERTHRESGYQDSAIVHTDQHGLTNATLSPAVTIPVHPNELDVLSHPLRNTYRPTPVRRRTTPAPSPLLAAESRLRAEAA